MPYVARPVYDVPDTPPLSKSARGPQTLGHDKRAQASLENEDFAANKVPRAQALRQASTNMSAASSSGSTRRTVTIAIDPGTTSTSVSYTIVGLREQPVCVTWGRDKSDAANYESPAIFHHKPRKSDGVLELLCGYELEEETRKQVVELEQVMSGLKVATLQHEDFSAQIRERIEEKVSNFGKTMADLWADYLDYLMKKTIDCIRRDTYFQANDRNTSDLILLIAQPNLSEPMDNTILVEAAQRIECTASYIVQEADCGATSVICEDKHLLQRLGDKLIVLDLGGGFCSPTAHEVRRDAKREGGFVLEPIASSNSRLAGSIFINQDFQNKLEYWMMQKNGETLEAQATALGYSVDGFKAKAAEHFEQRAKKLFPKDDTYDITVTSRYKKMRTCWSMELTRDDIKKLFEYRMRQSYGAFDELLSQLPDKSGLKFVILRGGLACNLWVQDEFRAKYPQFKVIVRATQILCPVPNGALLSHRNRQAIEQHFFLGTVRHEILRTSNPRYQDIVLRRDSKGRPELNDKLWFKGNINPNEKWAKQRLNWFVKKDDTKDNWRTVVSWELLHIEPQESLDAEYTQPQILHYARKINADGEPLLKADGKTVQDHIAQFCEIEVNLGKRVGWKKVSSPDGTQFFEVWLGTRVILPKAGPMSGAWEIRHAVQAIAPESSDAVSGKWKARAANVKIFDPKFSHVPLQ